MGVTFTHKPKAMGQIVLNYFFFWWKWPCFDSYYYYQYKEESSFFFSPSLYMYMCVWMVGILASLEAGGFHRPVHSTFRVCKAGSARHCPSPSPEFSFSICPRAPLRLTGGRGGRWLDERAHRKNTTPQREREREIYHSRNPLFSISLSLLRHGHPITSIILPLSSSLLPALSLCCAVAGG